MAGTYTVLVDKNNTNRFGVFKSTTPTTNTDSSWVLSGTNSIQTPNAIKSLWGVMSYNQMRSIAWGGTNSAPFVGTTSIPYVAQSFTATANRLLCISVEVGRSATSPSDNITMEIQSDSSGSPSGTVVATSTSSYAGSTLSTGQTGSPTFSFLFNQIQLTNNTKYWMVLRRTGSLNDTAFYFVGASSAATGDTSGHVARQYNGSSWSDTSSIYYKLFDNSGIHITTQETGRVAYHKFDTSTDTWSIVNEVIDNSFTLSADQGVSHTVLSDGSVVALYQSATGFVNYKKRSSSGTWGSAVTVKNGGFAGLALLGDSDRVHFFYFPTALGQLLHRSLTSAGTLNTEQIIDSSNISATMKHFSSPGMYNTATAQYYIVYRGPSGSSSPLNVVSFTSADTITTSGFTGQAASTLETNATVEGAITFSSVPHLVRIKSTDSDIYKITSSDTTGSFGGTDTDIQTGSVTDLSVNIA